MPNKNVVLDARRSPCLKCKENSLGCFKKCKILKAWQEHFGNPVDQNKATFQSPIGACRYVPRRKGNGHF